MTLSEKVTIELDEGHLINKPVVKTDEDFAENLLEQLIVAGFSGKDL